MSDYYIRRLQKKNLYQLLPIFNDAFNSSPSLEALKNKHETDFAGCSEVGYIAYDNNMEPVAFYGVFPLKVQIYNKISLICQSGDTMVKKAHGGRGLFTKLAIKTYELCKNNKINGVIGFPNKNSYRGLLNLKWNYNENLNRYQFYTLTLPFSYLLQGSKILKNIHRKWINFILKFFNKGEFFKSSVSSDHNNSIFRDKDFWNYKLLNKEIFLIKICDCNLVIKINKLIEIGDIEYKDYEELKQIIKKIKLLGIILGINIIRFYCSPSCRIDNDMNKLKKPSKGLAIGFRSFNQKFDLSRVKYTSLDIDTF